MRLLGLTLCIGLAACSAPHGDAPESAPTQRHTAPTQRHTAKAESTAVSASPKPAPGAGIFDAGAPFTGVWEECDEGGSPDECSRYLLLQHGDQICGTWAYVATADLYYGHLEAKALSATSARRTKVCGRPGSETQTECDAGWESIDKPLELCDDKLAERTGDTGECKARYARSAQPGTQLTTLANEPWVKACLAGAAEGTR